MVVCAAATRAAAGPGALPAQPGGTDARHCLHAGQGGTAQPVEASDGGQLQPGAIQQVLQPSQAPPCRVCGSCASQGSSTREQGNPLAPYRQVPTAQAQAVRQHQRPHGSIRSIIRLCHCADLVVTGGLTVEGVDSRSAGPSSQPARMPEIDVQDNKGARAAWPACIC